MAEAYKGLTIRFGAVDKNIVSAMKEMKRAALDTQSELNAVTRALKMDPDNIILAKRHLSLLGEESRAAANSAATLERSLKEIGARKLRDGAASVKELAEQTDNASIAADKARRKYNLVVGQLERNYTALHKVWQETKSLASTPSPFEAMHKDGELVVHDLSSIEGGLEALKTEGRLSAEEVERLKNAFRELKAEHKNALNTHEEKKAIAQYKSLENQVSLAWAKAKKSNRDYVRNLAKSLTKQSQFEQKVRASKVAMDALADEGKRLKDALSLNPYGLDATIAKVRNLRDQSRVTEEHVEALKLKLDELSKDKAAADLAGDQVRLQHELAESAAELEEFQNEWDELSAKAREAEIRMENAFKGLQSADKTEAELEQLQKDYEAAGRDATEYGEKAAAAQRKVQAATQRSATAMNAQQIAQTNGAIVAGTAALQGYDKELKNSSRRSIITSSSLTSMGMSLFSTVTPAVMMMGERGIEAAKEFDSAYRDMRKTVNGEEKDFEALKQAALDFGDTHFTSASTMMEIQALGGQLGIPIDNLQEFGEVVADLDIATNMQAEDIALNLGKMANVMHLDVSDYRSFADALVRLGNNEPALESDIMEITTRFMGMGSIVGMSADEMLAWSTAATATGQKAEAAGGSMQRFLGRIEAAVAGASDELMEWSELSEEEMEEAAGDLAEYARVAGMTPDVFAELWNDKEGGGVSKALQAFIEGLQRINEEGGSAEKTLQDLGIRNVRDKQLLEGLTNTTDVLAESLEMSYNAYNGIDDEYGDAGDAAREAERKCEGFSGELQMLENKGEHLAAVFGDALVPVLKTMNEILGDLVGFVDSLSDEQKIQALVALASSAAAGPLMTFGGSIMNIGSNAAAAFTDMLSPAKRFEKTEARLAKISPGLASTFTKNSAKISKFTASMKAGASSVGGLEKGMLRSAAAAKAANVGLSALSAGTSLIGGSLKVLLPILAAVAAGFAIYEGFKLVDRYRQSTDGLRESMSNMAYMLNGVNIDASGFDGAKEKANDYDTSLLSIWNRTQDVINRNAELKQSIDETFTAAGLKVSDLESAREVINDLLEKPGITAQELADLQTAVETLNSLTGSNFELDGSVADGYFLIEDGARKAKEEVDKLIESEELRIRREATSEMRKEAYRTQAENAMAMRDAAEAYAAAEKELEELEAKLGNRNKTRGVNQAKYGGAGQNRSPAIESARDRATAAKAALDEIRAQVEESDRLVESLEGLDTVYMMAMGDFADNPAITAIADNAEVLQAFIDAGKGGADFMANLASDLATVGANADQLKGITREGAEALALHYNGQFSSIANDLARVVDYDKDMAEALDSAELIAATMRDDFPIATNAVTGTGQAFDGFLAQMLLAGENVGVLYDLSDQQLTKLVESYDGNIDAIMAKIGEFKDTNENMIAAVREKLGDEMPDITDESLSYFADALSMKGEGAMDGLVSVLQNYPRDKVGEAVKDAVSTGSTAAFDAMLLEINDGDVDKTMEQLGRDIDEGLKNGIEGYTDIPQSAVGIMSQDTIDKAKEMFDSHSPSRVFKDIGQDVDQGLALGITGNKNLPITAAKAIAKAVTSSFRDAIDVTAANYRAAQMAQNAVYAMRVSAYSSGSYMAQGFYQGMSSWAGSIATRAAQMAQSAVNAVKKAGGEGSPWSTTMESGKFAALGLAEGIERYSKYPAMAAGDMVSASLRSMQDAKVSLPQIEYAQTADITATAAKLLDFYERSRTLSEDNSKHYHIYIDGIEVPSDSDFGEALMAWLDDAGRLAAQ